ncbi:site-2 protease family protein [Streptomyces sp. CB03238]|uniref:site-2 protease family protein n=1 Tax=Streptomyces sp. CB03238 TaxID=1907777 RepID=UPI000A106CD2|nr:site-2 protease family protein [Streptomyces sp. CB03238]ORT60388.1 hypothetical protein BKD26_08380 [Streptomyces sp. CB03238]
MATATSRHSDRRVSPVFLGIAAIMAVTGWAVWTGFSANLGLAVFLFVTAGWIVSLCLHEYAHARTAHHGGDITIGAKGYLTLNPLKYTHPLLSIVLPVVFVIMGGLGLPGGAVFIEQDRIRSRVKRSLVSAAGPLTNAVCVVLFTAPFWLGALDGVPVPFRFALAFLALLEVSAVILNFLPVPGLDGYGVIEPWLSYKIRRQIQPYAAYGLLAVFACLFFIPEVRDAFFTLVHTVMQGLGIEELETYCGRDLYLFWQEQSAACQDLVSQ